MKEKYSSRLKNLGTETAFEVSQDAAKFKSDGNKVYPFHLGDINIPTPANIMEAANKAMYDGKTGYISSVGIPQLRDSLADLTGSERGVYYNCENVVIQPGGKPVISKFIQSLMNPRDGVLYPNPGYPIYESQIEFHGGHALPYGFIPTSDGFKIDRETVESLIGSNTRLFIYNNYHNPTGAESSIDEMEWIAELAQKHDLWVLSDEAYFEIQYSGKPKSIVSIPGMKERTVILYTFSKTYAMTGWRLGAAIGPRELMKVFAKLSVNDESCTNHFIQYGGIEALTGNQAGVKVILNELRRRRDALADILNQIDEISFFTPNSTFYLFPDVTDLYHHVEAQSYEEFRAKILQATGVSFCTREHFGTSLPNEDRKYIRFAYSGITVDDIKEGMGRFNEYWRSFNSVEAV